VIIGLWGYRSIARSDLEEFSGFTRSIHFIFFTGIVLLGLMFLPSFIQKLPNTAFPAVQAFLEQPQKFNFRNYAIEELGLLFERKVENAEAEDAVKLIEKYAPEQPRVTVFTAGSTGVLLVTQKAQVYPISDPVEDSLSSAVSRLILTHPNPYQPGDVIFLASNPENLKLAGNKQCYLATSTSSQCSQVEIQFQLVQQICSRFGFDEIEKSANGVSAIRLTAPGVGTSDYCHRLNTFLGIQDK
jgi:hypothetical protein